MGIYSKTGMKVMGYDLKKEYCIWLGYMHILGVIGAIWLCFRDSALIWKSLGWLAFFHCMTGLGITGGCHRMWSHRAYTGNIVYRSMMMILQSSAFQGSIFHWSRDHRLHHKYSDTSIDPHTMSKGFFFAHVGWLLVKKSPELMEAGRKIDVSDLLADPVVVFQKKHYYKIAVMSCFVVPMLIIQWTIGGGYLFNFFMCCTRYICQLNATWCVNSVCHMYGSRPYNSNILPTENLLVSLLAVGEGWHNWHHEYPRDWRASENKWTKINFTSAWIKFFRFLGMAQTPKLVHEKE